MKTKLHQSLLLTILCSLMANAVHAQASCASAATLTSASSCNTTTGNMQNASNAAPTGACGGATATTTYGVWYKFTAASSAPTITVNNLGNNLNAATTYVQVLSGSCGSFSSLACQNVSSRLVLSGLTIGTVYYVRVYVTANPTGNPANKWAFDICIQDGPANDNCSGAITLTSNAACSNTSTTMDLATPSTGLPAGCESAAAHYDVWYKFVAAGSVEVITISNLGADITGPEIQLYSGSCGALTSLSCGTTSVAGTSLTIGNTYYVRVSNTGSSPSTNGAAGFSICVAHPTPAKIDYSKSYINVTRGASGGTVNPGDTLEMRATFVVSSKTVDSLSFMDTLYNGRGLRLVPGSVALRTNEGKIYKSFTDIIDADAGWTYASGSDTVIRINFGTGASSFARGQLTNTSRPSVFNSTCIVMATYRVVVYAGYNTLINFRTGALTYRDATTTVMNTLKFVADNFIVYQSPGLCPNAVSATNALGAEFNGTFGTPSGSAPYSRNRGTSPYTSYTYTPFNSAGGPQDYFYGIANNTSSLFTTLNTWPKPDAGGYRVFTQWDITGDHTGATNPSKGNPACDTTKPISATNPCGYMLVINSAYRTDTAFNYTVTNLCPNTYYEISAWLKNICYKCGCDSTGAGAAAVGYIPSAPNDSSGVQPNIAFDVNGTDYYTTGNIPYSGVTPTGSDSTNRWVKRGFVYLTGPSETSFVLTLRNNAPGGGGNDWALDDISVATCLPNMNYSPSLNPTTCKQNVVTIYDTVRSYFNNYQYYKWQRSTNNGASWTDVAGASGSSTPVWNGSSWQYITGYSIPPSLTDSINNGDKYRVVVSTTSGNLSNSNCQVTDGVSIINLNVISCSGDPLGTSLLSFTGKYIHNEARLSWSTSMEQEPYSFEVEKSTDQRNFYKIATVRSYMNTSAASNDYHFTDSDSLSGKMFYRVAMVGNKGDRKYSRIIQLNGYGEELVLGNLTNPFSRELFFDILASRDVRVDLTLSDLFGHAVRQQSFTAQSGITSYSLKNLSALPNGMYTLQISYEGKTIWKKVMKQPAR